MQALAFLSAILGLSSAAVVAPRDTTACNNSPDLCSKSYSSIAYLGAHDSPFVRDASTQYSTSGNQYYNSTVQLAAGVRMLSAQVHNSNNALHLCHTSCDLLDAGLLSAWLSEIKKWMDSNPNEVVSLLLVNSDNATPSALASEFTASGITTYKYTPPSTTTAQFTWPTLQELISNNNRLMTFVASLDTSTIDPTNSYLMNEFTFIFENSFETSSLTNFTCTPDRPSSVTGDTASAVSSGRMPLMNHFLYDGSLFGIDTPNVGNITTTNALSGTTGNLGSSASTCRTAYGKTPVFILVDFFDQGPAIATVDSLNGVTSPVGRTAVPSKGKQSSSGAGRKTSMFKGVVDLVHLVHSGVEPSLGAWIWAGGDWGKTFGGINLSGGKVIT